MTSVPSSSFAQYKDNKGKLPKNFIQLCQENNVDPTIYTDSTRLPRFIRVNPRNSILQDELEAQLKTSVKKVNWIPSSEQFYELSSEAKIKQSNIYEKGQIYGMDIYVVHQVCGKLCYIADKLWQQTPSELRDAPVFTVTGIDLNIDRLYATRSIVTKYRVPNVRLILADGTTFTIGESENNDHYESSKTLKLNSSIKNTTTSTNTTVNQNYGGKLIHRRGKRLKKLISSVAHQNNITNNNNNNNNNISLENEGILFYQSYGMYHINNKMHIKHNGVISFPTGTVEPVCDNTKTEDSIIPRIEIQQYDRVLVDAECTHDGSVRHVQKMLKNKNSAQVIQQCILDDDRRSSVSNLQRRLIWNGFRQLKTNGILVYSTCSMCREQDEEVVEWMLDQAKDRIELVDGMKKLMDILECESSLYSGTNRNNHDHPWVSGAVPGTIRMNPSISGTSGMFIAVLKKIK